MIARRPSHRCAFALAAPLVLALASCAKQPLDLGGDAPDAGHNAGPRDAGSAAADAETPEDAGQRPDAAPPPDDAGLSIDASVVGTLDASAADSGALDSGASDAGIAPLDAGGPARGQVVEVALGRAHTCARLEDGELACLGANDFHQTGTDERGGARCAPCVQDTRHVDVGGAPTALRAGGENTCIVRGGRVACVGRNTFGQLGRGLADENPHAGYVDVGPSGVTDLAVGRHHVCVVHGGAVSCAGLGHAGQLGLTPAERCAVPPDVATEEGLSGTAPCATSFASVPGLTDITALRVVRHTTCALSGAGAVTCFGEAAPLPGERTSPLPPTRIPELDGLPFALGLTHTCALVSGQVACAGEHQSGQLGFGATPPGSCGVARCPTRVPLIDLPASDAVAAGERFSCARLSPTDLRCWGAAADGRLGISAPGDLDTCGAAPCSRTPRRVVLMSIHEGLGAPVASTRHACAITDLQNLVCWGANDRAQIGRTTRPEQDLVTTPSFVYGL